MAFLLRSVMRGDSVNSVKIIMLNPPFLPKYSRASRSPAVTKSGTIYYPTWLAYATGVLEASGHVVRLVDAPASALDAMAVLDMLDEFEPDLVVVDTSTASILSDLRFAEEIKLRRRSSFVVLVGTHVSALPTQALEQAPGVDAVARREYDYTVRDLAAALSSHEDLSKVLGLSYRTDGRVVHNEDRPLISNLDNLPFVSEVFKRHLNIGNYFYAHLQYPMVSIFTSRGCPAQCIWCLYPQVFYGHQFRHRSPENIASEFAYIADALPQVREVLVDDDTFTIDVKHTRRTCELLIKQGNRLPWTCEVRVNNLDFETMQAMREAGCRLLVAGFESGNAQILKNMKKGTTPDQGRKFVRDARRAGLLVHGCFVAGNPGESKETLQETLDYAKRLDLDTAQFFPIMVYPGTEAFDWAKTQGYLLTEDFSQWLTADGLHNTIIDLPGLDHRQLVDWCDFARRSFYLRPRYVIYKVAQALVNPREFRRTLKASRRFYRFLFKRSSDSARI